MTNIPESNVSQRTADHVGEHEKQPATSDQQDSTQLDITDGSANIKGVPLLTGNVPPEFFNMHVMQKMCERLSQPHQSGKIKNTVIFLPSYDSDSNIGIREWCDHISTAKNNYNLNDYDIRMKITSGAIHVTKLQ